jgi:flagellar basal body-associated protein FliL
MNDKDISSIENPMLRFEKIVENLNKSNKSMSVSDGITYTKNLKKKLEALEAKEEKVEV